MLRYRIMVLGLMLAQCVAVRAADFDETADSAIWLLRKATLVHRDGRHNILLRALRQMRDPALTPLYNDLVSKQYSVLKIHGILGLGEVSEKKTIDMALLADLKDPLAQAQLVSTAIELRLLSTEQCLQLLGWPDLAPAAKVLVAGQLLADGQLKDAAVLEKAQGSDTPALRGMIALIRLQLGDKEALKVLRELDQIQDASRDPVRAMLLQTAERHNFDAVVPWAMDIAMGSRSDKGLSFQGLRVALHFKAPTGGATWNKLFAASDNPADRIRLALLALDMADRIDLKIFDTLAGDRDELVRQCGRVGQAIASGQSLQDELLKMLELNHLVAGQWVLQYTERLKPKEASAVLAGIILAAEGSANQDRFRSQRLENCVFAAQRMAENDPGAHGVLTELIRTSPELTQEAILMGLIRSSIANPQAIVPDAAELQGQTGQSLALLLQAKHGQKLNADQMKSLELIVRGGAGLQEPLRIQAAWTYLKITQQDKLALANVLKP